MSGSGTKPEQTRTMRYWLGRTLRETRNAAGKDLLDISQELRRNGLSTTEPTVSRIETSPGWPRDLDAIVAAYAEVCRIEDPRDLWEKALGAWISRGGIPYLGSLTPERSAELLALEARKRSLQRAGESQAKPISSRKRRKAP